MEKLERLVRRLVQIRHCRHFVLMRMYCSRHGTLLRVLMRTANVVPQSRFTKKPIARNRLLCESRLRHDVRSAHEHPKEGPMATTIHTHEYEMPAVADLHEPTYQAFQLLHWGFVALPAIAGADKFLDLLTSWDAY